MGIVDNWLGEVIGLASGAKRMATLEIVDKRQINELKNALDHYAPQKSFKFLKTPAYEWIKKVNPRYKFSLLVGENKSDLKEFKKLYGRAYDNNVSGGFEDHVRIGKLLSYPECCAKDHWNPKVGKSFRYYFKTGQVNQIDFRINNFYIRSDCNASIILHYVCSYDCEKTIQYVSEVLDFLKENYPEIYSFYRRVLRLPVLIIFPHDNPTIRTIGDGVVIPFRGEFKDEKTLIYDKIYRPPFHCYKNSEEGKKIYKKIAKGEKIKLRDRGIEIYSGEEHIENINNDRLVFVDPE